MVKVIQGTIKYTRATVKELNEFLGLGNDKARYVKDDVLRADRMKLTATYMNLAQILQLAQPDEKRFIVVD
jgi:hypothetical protein